MNLKQIFPKILTVFFLFICSFSFSQKVYLKGKVRDKFGPLPGARLTIEGNIKSTKTDVNGEYEFSLDPGEYIVTATNIMHTPLTKELFLEIGDTIIEDFLLQSTNAIDEEFNIGLRGRKTSLLDASLPVTIITPDQIENSGQIELGQILHYLSPIFHSTHQTISDGTDHIDPSTMRGLGPDQVLVLINGKRRHVSSLLNVNGTLGKGSVGTDFNAIPVSIIERIEFLTDGAAAIYGSDAIAGVINIVLKTETGILNIFNKAGINTEGDGFSNLNGVNVGFDIGNKGFINLTGEYKQKQATNRAGEYTGSIFNDNPVLDQQAIDANGFYDQTGYESKQIMEIGNAATTDLSFFFNSEIEISNKASTYAFGGTNFREGRSRGFYRLPINKAAVVSELYPNGFSPELVLNIQDKALTVGVHGYTKKWYADFSNSVGVNQFDVTVRNSNNASLGILSPNTFYAGGYLYKQNSTNLDFSREYDFLEGTNLSFGGQIRIENYQITPGELTSWQNLEQYQIVNNDTVYGQVGSQVYPGLQSINQLNKFRTSQSVYFDVETNVSTKFLLRGALRYEAGDNSEGKGEFVTKLSGRYKLNKQYSFRLGVATGYREPSLHQKYFNNISTQFINGESIEVGTFNNISIVTEAFNIEKLKAELSTHYNIGFTGKLNDNLNVNIELYSTFIEDRIVLSGRLENGYEDVLDPLNVGVAQFFINQIDTRTNGIDFSFFYEKITRHGNIETVLTGNLSKTNIVGFNDEDDAFDIEMSDLFNREERARIESSQPNVKIILAVNYEMKKWSFGINNVLFGKLTYLHPDDELEENWVLNEFSGERESRDQTYKSKIVTDLSIGYKLKHNISSFLRVNNAFNIYPDKIAHSANTSQGNFIYSRRVQQFGVKGTSINLGLNLKL